MKEITRFVADIPKELKVKFKKVAIEKETTMTDLLTKYIESEYKKIKK